MKPHHLYVLGMGSIGLAVGVLTALSRSPVVAVVVPLLFGLIAGASGLWLAREDVGEVDGRRRLAFAGAGITALSTGLLAGLFGTLAGNRPAADVPIHVLAAEAGAFDSDGQLRAAELRAVAAMLGASVDERNAIVRSAFAERAVLSDTVRDPATDDDGELASALNAVAQLEPPPTAPKEIAGDIVSLAAKARATISLEAAGEASLTLRNGANLLRPELDRLIGGGFSDAFVPELLVNSPEVLEALMRLRIALDPVPLRRSAATSTLPMSGQRRDVIELLQKMPPEATQFGRPPLDVEVLVPSGE